MQWPSIEVTNADMIVVKYKSNGMRQCVFESNGCERAVVAAVHILVYRSRKESDEPQLNNRRANVLCERNVLKAKSFLKCFPLPTNMT